MKNFSFLIITTAFLTLFGCNSKSLEDKFNKTTYEEDIATLLENKLLNEEEDSLLRAYITLNESDSLASSISSDASYGEILSTVKKEKEEREKIDKEIAEKKKKIGESVTISFSRKYTEEFIDEGSLKNFLIIDIFAQNNSDKTISGFTVLVTFRNSDGVAFYSGEWPIADVVKANSKKLIYLNGGEFKNTNEDQRILKMADQSKIKFEYEILELLYDDGTSLSVK
jgi:hypothetical protein